MRFVDSRCIHCGANLRVASDATHVCCQYCNAELIVVRDGDRLTTQMVREMKEDLGQKLDVLRVQNEIDRLDREWDLERESYTVGHKDGSRSVPSSTGSIVGGIVMIVFGIFWTTMASNIVGHAKSGPFDSTPAPFSFFPLIGVVFIGIAIFQMISGVSKASSHGTAEERYRSTRRRLLTELDQVQRQSKTTGQRRP